MCAVLGFVCEVLKKKRQSFENVCKYLKKKPIIIIIIIIIKTNLLDQLMISKIKSFY